MSKNPNFLDVAIAVRLEKHEQTGELYIVFKIIDEKFKQKVINNWNSNIELCLVEKNEKK